jgi:hypothetical protein
MGNTHLRKERDSVSGKLCFLIFRIPDYDQSKNPVILKSVYDTNQRGGWR